MVKKNRDKFKLLILGISAAITLCIVWFKSQNELKKELAETIRKNKILIQLAGLIEKERNHWQNTYYSHLSWLQGFQQIPNPKEAIKEIILELEKLNTEIFCDRPGYIREIEDSIYALRGEKLQTSFRNLAKIVENLLEEKLINNPEFQLKFYKLLLKGPDKLNLGIFLDYSTQKEFFESNTNDFLETIKNLRNDFSHEIAPEIDENILIGFHIRIVQTIIFLVNEDWSK